MSTTELMLVNGRLVDLTDPRLRPEDLSSLIEQCAKEARYNGATPGVFYSSAEHCVRGADYLFNSQKLVREAAYFLAHDLHEGAWRDDTTPKKRAIEQECDLRLGDLSGPIKAVVRNVEYRLERAVHEACGLTFPLDADVQVLVKEIDRRMFVTEWQQLMPGRKLPEGYDGVEPLPIEIKPWNWENAWNAYVSRAMVLFPAWTGRHT